MAENFPQLMTETKPQIQAVHETQSRISTKNSVPSHIIFKQQKTKDKEKIFKI